MVTLVFGYGGVSDSTAANLFATVKSLRFSSNQGVTRLVIETDKPLPYSLFSLADPDRLVIDLPELDWQDHDKGSNISSGLMVGYRVGLFKSGVSRLVFDLKEPIKLKTRLSLPEDAKYGPRLVFDIMAENGKNGDNETAGGTLQYATNDWASYQKNNVKEPSIPNQTNLDKKSKQLPLIVIDPGHGGIDPGAISASKAFEKDIVLNFALKIAETLNQSKKYRVELTRDRDIFIPLRQRYDLAQKMNADIFISIHADSHSDSKMRGGTIYTLSDKASDAEADALAAKENKSDILAGTNLDNYAPEVSTILIDLAQQSVNQSSWYLGESLVNKLAKQVNLLAGKAHRFAGFAVLKSPNIPSSLIEIGYLSNKHDEANLQNEAYIKKFAEGLHSALDDYFEHNHILNPDVAKSN